MDWVLRQREKENEWNPQYWDPCPRRPKSGHSFGSISRGLQSRAADALCEVNTEEQTTVASNPIFNLDTPAVTPLWVSATLYHHCKYLQHSECRPNCPESECSESGTAPTSKLNMDSRWICVYSAVVSILLWLTGETNILQCVDAPLKAQYGPWQVCICVHSSVIPIFLGVD